MTNQEIKTVGQTIAQETQIGGNTAARVGGVVEGIGVALDNKDAANGYYQATINGGTITVNAPNYLLGSGGNLRIKMPSAGTTASTLTIGNANAVQLWYNGAAVSAQNTWEADEVISVFYDGTRFLASNSQGGGGKAEKIIYDNSQSGLAAENVQGALDESAASMAASKVLDITNNNLIGLATSGNKKWDNSNGYTGFVLPVSDGEVYDIIAQENKVSVILPLKVSTWKNGTSYATNIATGYDDRYTIQQGQIYRFEVPSDCTCLYVQTTLSAGDITPTIIKRETMATLAETPMTGEKGGVTSDGVFKSTSVRILPLSLAQTVSKFQLSALMRWEEYKTSGNIRNSELYHVTEGENIHLKAANGNTNFAFLESPGTIADKSYPASASGRYSLSSGESVDVVVPQNAHYLYVATFTTATGNQRPFMAKYVKTTDALSCLGYNFKLTGEDTNTVGSRTILKGGGIYQVVFDKQKWNITSLSSSAVWFGMTINGSYIDRATKNGKGEYPKSCYYLYAEEDVDFCVVARADAGETIGVAVNEVTNNFNKRIYDVYFVDGETVSESMMVKVGIGDLVKYRLNADAEMAVVKIYSKAVRDDDYLVDSIIAEEAGVLEGQFMTPICNDGTFYHEVFVAMESVISSGFAPSFQVYNYGKAEDNKIVYPYQFIVDPDGDIFDTGEGGGKKIIFSTDDETATEYDDGLLNYAQIIPGDGIYYMIYQAFGATSHKSSNICFAYSSDGLNWTKGFPQGIEAPIADTNVIFDRSNTYSLIPEFAANKEVINEFAVAVVNDINNKYRMFCAVRNVPDYSHDPDGTIVGMCHYLLKSNDLVHWSVVKKVDTKPHDSFSSMFCYDGDKLKLYLRMWDYNQPSDKQRMVGVMWLDIWGNVIVPASGIGLRGDYNPAATRINPIQDLMIPTRFYAGSGGSIMSGTDNLESYIVDGNKIWYAPSYNLDKVKDGDVEGGLNGWCFGAGLVAVGMKQYFLCGIRGASHGTDVEVSASQIRLYPIKWITYDSYNTSGGVG